MPYRRLQFTRLLLGLALLFTPLFGLAQPAMAASGGTVVAWGRNDYGQRNVPDGLSNVTAMAAGRVHSLALKGDGTVVAWGSNDYGETSVSDGLSDVTAIAAGFFHSLALKSDGTVVAWGHNYAGQTDVPSDLSDVTAIAAGSGNSLALKRDGTVVAWGDNTWGQASVPSGLSNVIAIATGYRHNLALKRDGTVVAWGYNQQGETNVPSGLSNVIAIGAGYFHSLVLKSDGTVVAWGQNGSGEGSVPAGLSGVTAIAAGGYHNLALKSDGTVVAWGDNSEGQRNVPSGLSGVMAIAASGEHNLALVPAVSDLTAPIIAPNIAGTLGNNGWYTSDVTMNWSVVDAESTISSQPGCDTTTVASDTHSVTFTCTATSAGGTNSQSVTIKRDATAPSLAPSVSPNPVVLNGDASAKPNATDNLSGIASANCGTLTTSSVGAKSVSCSATDTAGNTASANVSYTVIYDFSGFFQPIDNLPILNSMKAGSAVAVRFSLAGNQGLSVLAAGSPASQQIACGTATTVDDVEQTVSASNSSLSYDATTGQYSYTWKTDKAWANTCRQLIVKLADGTNHFANFKFK
jgi:alpha-tubulin suppressor-like RCC1 family protein